MAARETGGLSLSDALLLCELLATADPSRYERAALRWLEWFINERLPPLTEVALAAWRSPNFGTDAAAWGSQLSRVYCAALSVSFSESFELGSGSLARARRDRAAALVRQAGTSR
jgi:hypothetical protein